MAKDTKNQQRAETKTTAARGDLELAIRQWARMLVDTIVGEKLEVALRVSLSVRVWETRAGYRPGTRE